MGFTQCFAICARLQRRLAARGVSMSVFQVEESSTLLRFGDSRETDNYAAEELFCLKMERAT